MEKPPSAIKVKRGDIGFQCETQGQSFSLLGTNSSLDFRGGIEVGRDNLKIMSLKTRESKAEEDLPLGSGAAQQ